MKSMLSILVLAIYDLAFAMVDHGDVGEGGSELGIGALIGLALFVYLIHKSNE